MTDLHIVRKHALGLPAARKIAFGWAEQVESDLGLHCVYEEGRATDSVRFSGSGVHGELKVARDRFELDARLGFLVSIFKGRIETEITRMLDQLLQPAVATPAPRKSAAGKSVAHKTAARKPAARKAART